MPNPEHFELLQAGVSEWNAWRETNPDVRPDLSQINFHGADLEKVNLSKCSLQDTVFIHAHFFEADFSGSDFRGSYASESDFGLSDFREADLDDFVGRLCNYRAANFAGTRMRGTFERSSFVEASLVGAELREAYMAETDLRFARFDCANLEGARLEKSNMQYASFRDAILIGANMQYASMVGTDFRGATIIRANVHGTSVWSAELEGAEQKDLVITDKFDDFTLTVDDLSIAQFIHLLISNDKVRSAIDTISSKVVLILGRFTPTRKAVLDSIKDELRELNLVPVIFDFEKPRSRDLTETISILAHLSAFVIADLTEPKSIPHELQRIIPDLPSVPVLPIIESPSREYGMFEHFKSYPWVKDVYHYSSITDIMSMIKTTATPFKQGT